MKVFVAGATGAIGRPLVRQLVERGHEVSGLTRSEERAEGLRAMGARALVGDALDAERLHQLVSVARPDVVVHELTDIPAAIDPKRLEEQFAGTNRLRTDGTRNLVAAAQATGARRVVGQSIAFAYAPVGGPVKTEEDPLMEDVPPSYRELFAAVAETERGLLAGPEGVVLRYGYFYGPRTAYAPDGSIAGMVRARRFPVVGKGTGVSSFIHVEDAASATVAAVEGGGPGIYNVTDDEPAPAAEWLPVYAAALGAPKPIHVPVFAARAIAGSYAVYLATEQRGASNAKARRALAWSLRHPSWRDGFRTALG